MDVTEILGLPYDSLLEAKVDKSPDEVVITEDEKTYYIVSTGNYENALSALGYTIVVKEGE